MTKNKIPGNIFENSALKHAQPLIQEDTLGQAEAALWKYFGLDFLSAGTTRSVLNY